MKTDIFVRILSKMPDATGRERDIDEAFSLFRRFSERFSRFRPESELSRFNGSEEQVVSPEFVDLLDRSSRWYHETGGVFDPSILPTLEAVGYAGSFGTESFGAPMEMEKSPARFDELSIDRETRMVHKPRNLRIDFGGIGKGYIVDRVTDFLRERYENFFVYAGGDIFAGGKNAESGYEYWAVDVEDPLGRGDSLVTLLLSDRAVATSGTNRRRWTIDGEKRHHLIDPRVRRSAETDLASVTVVAPSVEEAEVWAKTFCILGLKQGKRLSEKRMIPTLFVPENGDMVYNAYIEPYVWKPA